MPAPLTNMDILNTSDDVRAVPDNYTPAQPQPPAKKKGTVSFPKDAVYDPSRDVNVPPDKIVTLSKLYSDYNKYKNELQLPPTFQEFLNNCIRDGVKIDQRTRK